jgi:hypothetical protein
VPVIKKGETVKKSFAGLIALGLIFQFLGYTASAGTDETDQGKADPVQVNSAAVPQCLAYNRDLPENNAQVLHWKRTTKNQFRERGHIVGTITAVFPDHSGHDHIEVTIGSREGDTIEIIYNEDFGEVPNPVLGMNVEACGDYITATQDTGRYPKSPDNAILHWVHMNPKSVGHAAGFLMVDGNLYGQQPDRRRH